MLFLADPGKARGCSSFSYISLRRRHAQTVINASRHKTNSMDIFSEILNLEGHQNHCIGSKVTAILPTGGVGKACFL